MTRYKPESCPIEDFECIYFHNWLDERGIPHAHIPNESRSGRKDAVIRARKLKSMGVSAGYWDYDVYIPVLDVDNNTGGYELIKIEMKRAKKSLSKVSDAQKKWGEIYDMTGIENYICYGALAAEYLVEEVYERINNRKLEKKPVEF